MLPVLYPGVFPNLDALNKSKKPRADLLAILLTGIPAGLIDGFTNLTGDVQADMLRLNTAIKPSSRPEPVRSAGRGPGRLPQRPPGRRRRGEHRAAGGGRGHRAAGGQEVHAGRGAGAVTPGLSAADVTAPFLRDFPFLGTPYDGFNNPAAAKS